MNISEEKRRQILQVAKRHGVTRVRVFGSVARGDAWPPSDPEIAIAVKRPLANCEDEGDTALWPS